jgi:hypothetical protein
MKASGNPPKPKPKNVLNVMHDPTTNDLHVVFGSGQQYIYHNVPADTYTEMMKAQSQGAYLHNVIKPKYAFHKGPQVFNKKIPKK